MRKDREENLDYLDEEDTGIEDERQGFSGSPKKRIAGARAFVGLMVLIGSAMVGWFIYNQMHVKKLADDPKKDKEQVMTSSLPRPRLSTTRQKIASFLRCRRRRSRSSRLRVKH